MGGVMVLRRMPALIRAVILLCSAAGAPVGALSTPDLPSSGIAQDGSLDLERFRGQVVLVDFWASWCGPCAKSFPWMAEMVRHHGPQGLVVVAVNVDEDQGDAERFLEGGDWPFRMVFDPAGRLAEAFALRTMPTTLLFDRQGRLVGRHEGFRERDTAEFERDLVDLLEQQTPSAATTDTMTVKRRRGAGVRPWQRSLLADPAMRLDADPLDLEFDDHIYFSKEASSGGRSFGGGGCGCN